MTQAPDMGANIRVPELGIEKADLKEINVGLAQAVSETFTLYVKTQGYHWNVVGPAFRALHEMFEEQYIELRDAADVLAERMRALGATAPGSFTEFMELAEIKDHEPVKDSTDMVRILADGHETAARIMRPLVEVCEKAGDSGTADLVTERLLSHAKHAWMLRAMIS